MTKILIIKTSSMGDILHTLPALTDAAKALPDVSFDWVIEEAFVEIPTWHPVVANIIPIAFRRFRKEPLQMLSKGEIKAFLKALRQNSYDYVIDAQGLIKSAVITRLTRGLRCGLDRKSAWEPLASMAYQKKIGVNPSLHAITRMRQLFAQTLGYAISESMPDYGLHLKLNHPPPRNKYLLFIHGTTWETKEWPEDYWRELSKLANQSHYDVLIPWGNSKEQQRANRIAAASPNVTVLPRTSLTEVAALLHAASGVVSVDTGLGHLAAALNVPTVSLYGPTDPKEVGTQGFKQRHLSVNFKCSPCWNEKCGYKQKKEEYTPCYASIPPQMVWEHLNQVIGDEK